jgi:hypothetical protein
MTLQGVFWLRNFELRRREDGTTDFAMEERFSGLILPLVRASMPDFGPVFERYARDLKREAERRQSESVTHRPTVAARR